jgi:hypothetical protein
MEDSKPSEQNLPPSRTEFYLENKGRKLIWNVGVHVPDDIPSSEVYLFFPNIIKYCWGSVIRNMLYVRFEVFTAVTMKNDRLCSLVVRVPGYRSRGRAFDSRRYQIFWEVVGLERGPLSFVSTTEELLGRKSSGSGLESLEYGSKDPTRWPRGTMHPQTLALTSPKSGGRSVGTVRSRTHATGVVFVLLTMKNAVFWDVALCGYIINRCFGRMLSPPSSR